MSLRARKLLCRCARLRLASEMALSDTAQTRRGCLRTPPRLEKDATATPAPGEARPHGPVRRAPNYASAQTEEESERGWEGAERRSKRGTEKMHLKCSKRRIKCFGTANQTLR